MRDKPIVRRRADDRAPPAPSEPETVESTSAPAFRRSPGAMQRPAAGPPQEEMVVSGRLSELEALAAMGSLDMADLLAGTPSAGRMPEPGARLKGRVIGLRGDELQIDVGQRTSAFMLRREVPGVAIGDEIEAWVVEADELGIQLSQRLSGSAASTFLDEAKEAGIPVEGQVVSRSGGGYEVRLGGARAFCPISHIARVPLADPDAVLGQTLPFLVIETGEKTVVSRRALEEREAKARRETFWERAAEGQVVVAVVTSVHAWGAFLDVDGVDARISRREIGWDEVQDATTRLARGQRLQVRIVELDPANGKVNVSTRDPSLDPWLQISRSLHPGELRDGKVISHAPFGTFVELLPGLQGLLHVSRSAGAPPADVGATVSVRVLSIDPEARRIELAPADFDPAAQARNAVGATVEGLVTDVEEAGVRIRLEDGRTAWLPAREVDLAPGQHLAHRFRQGFSVKGRVISEQPGGRVTLSQRDDDGGDGWRRAPLDTTPRGGMGTLGDLFRKRK
jgi:small subunit ribosomal protein S1